MINGSALFDGVAPAHFRYRMSSDHGTCRLFLGLSAPLYDIVFARSHKATTNAAHAFRDWETTSVIMAPDREGWRWLEFRLTDSSTILEALNVLDAINLLAFMAPHETLALYDVKHRRQHLHVWPRLVSSKDGAPQAHIEISLWHEARQLLGRHSRFLDFDRLDRLDEQLGKINGLGDLTDRLGSWSVEPDGCIVLACKADDVTLGPVGDRRRERVIHATPQPTSLRHTASFLVAGAWLDSQLEQLLFVK